MSARPLARRSAAGTWPISWPATWTTSALARAWSARSSRRSATRPGGERAEVGGQGQVEPADQVVAGERRLAVVAVAGLQRLGDHCLRGERLGPTAGWGGGGEVLGRTRRPGGSGRRRRRSRPRPATGRSARPRTRSRGSWRGGSPGWRPAGCGCARCCSPAARSPPRTRSSRRSASAVMACRRQENRSSSAGSIPTTRRPMPSSRISHAMPRRRVSSISSSRSETAAARGPGGVQGLAVQGPPRAVLALDLVQHGLVDVQLRVVVAGGVLQEPGHGQGLGVLPPPGAAAAPCRPVRV